jgi:hypothetical protein
VAIADPATAHFTAIKNLGNTRTAYKPRHTHTHTQGKTQVAISDTATHRPKHARGGAKIPLLPAAFLELFNPVEAKGKGKVVPGLN